MRSMIWRGNIAKKGNTELGTSLHECMKICSPSLAVHAAWLGQGIPQILCRMLIYPANHCHSFSLVDPAYMHSKAQSGPSNIYRPQYADSSYSKEERDNTEKVILQNKLIILWRGKVYIQDTWGGCTVHNIDVKGSSIGPDWHLPQLSRRKGGGGGDISCYCDGSLKVLVIPTTSCSSASYCQFYLSG
jgi:hypothetical protein